MMAVNRDQIDVEDVSRQHWARVSRLNLILGVLWLGATLLPLFLLAPVEGRNVFGWPFAYALVAFVVPVFYLLLVTVYVFMTGRYERTRRAQEALYQVQKDGASP